MTSDARDRLDGIPPPPPADLTCPTCSGTDFRREHTRFPGKQLQRRFKATLMICGTCSRMLLFAGWHHPDDADPTTGAVV